MNYMLLGIIALCAIAILTFFFYWFKKWSQKIIDEAVDKINTNYKNTQIHISSREVLDGTRIQSENDKKTN